MIEKRVPKVIRYILLLLWMAVIYVFSDQPNSNETTLEIFGSFNYWVRKAAHMSEYAILFLLFNSCISPSITTRERNDDDTAGDDDKSRQKAEFISPVAVEFFLTVLYACSDEWHQSFVPGRSALLSDVLIDSAGALIPALFVLGKNQRTKPTADQSKS